MQDTIEKVKEYWNSRPCNIKHSPSPIGTKQYFDEVEARKYFVEPHIPIFTDFSRWRGKKVLEIGCGIGTDTISFAREGAEVTAVELSEKSLALAKTRAKVYNLESKIKFYLGNAEQLSKFVPVEPYDLIYSFGVIHHTPNPEKIMEEIKKYAKAGTVVKIMVYHKYSFKVLWILFSFGKGAFWKINGLVVRYSEAKEHSPVTYTYSKKEAKELMKGFKITDMSVEHIFPYKISDYIKYKYTKVWYFRFLPKSFFRQLERHFGWHLLITAVGRE
ncbi:MAG: type 12 methyltransferase [Parcubacteria group bacterium Gr01-1014_30]|nr:MAG: type 12 methyltransferase [Parcubacteria group bacterium Gr01-1014_30]